MAGNSNHPWKHGQATPPTLRGAKTHPMKALRHHLRPIVDSKKRYHGEFDGNSMGIRWEFYGDIWLVGGAMCPSWKMMEFVNGKDDIPRLCQKNEMDFFKASHVPNHQMGTCWSPGWWNLGITWGITQAIFENWILGEHLHREPMGHGFSKPVHWALKKVGQLISDEHLQLILW